MALEVVGSSPIAHPRHYCSAEAGLFYFHPLRAEHPDKEKQTAPTKSRIRENNKREAAGLSEERWKEFAGKIDISLLDPRMTAEDVREFCTKALDYHFAALSCRRLSWKWPKAS